MYIRREKGPASVVLPDGKMLTRSDLPPADTRRWVARRKATVLAAVDHGLIDAEEAQRRYQISAEELENWREATRRHGTAALRVTALQKYRTPKPQGSALRAAPGETGGGEPADLGNFPGRTIGSALA